MAGFPKEYVPNLEIWTPDMAEGERLAGALSDLRSIGIVAAHGLTQELEAEIGAMPKHDCLVGFCGEDPPSIDDPDESQPWTDVGREFFSLHAAVGHEGRDLTGASVQPDDLQFLAYGAVGPGQAMYGDFNRIPGAEIASEYRTIQRNDEKLTEPLVRFVLGVTLQLYADIEPETIWTALWLEGIGSNNAAPHKRSGFTQVTSLLPGFRLTTEEVGTPIFDSKARAVTDEERKDTGRRYFVDRAQFLRYDPDHLYNYRGERKSR